MAGNEGNEPFWAIVEVKGFSQFAGLVSEAQIAGAGFIRVDVPAIGPNSPAFTKLFEPKAIHCITPTDEQSARMMVLRLSAPAIPANLARLVSGDNGGW